MIGWFLFSRDYWDDVFYTEIPPDMKEEDFIVISKGKNEKEEKVYINKKTMGKLMLA